jgi:sulfatase maturation enzyme AslB (radical SAM superfamily)
VGQIHNGAIGVNLRGRHYIQTQEGLNAYADEIRTMNLPEYGVVIDIKFGVRTTKQNSSMHLYFSMLAKALNDAGYHMARTLKEGAEIDWTEASIKKEVWGKVMEPLTGKTHTSDLERNEVSEIYENVNRFIATRTGVMVAFPSKEQL